MSVGWRGSWRGMLRIRGEGRLDYGGLGMLCKRGS